MNVTVDATLFQHLLSVMDAPVGASATLTYGMLAAIVVAAAAFFIYLKI